MIHVLVKGSRFVAQWAANRRRIPYTYLRERRGDTSLLVPNAYEAAVVRWFCEPGQTPFPPGTALHYAPLRTD
jgi:hypothetical protein